jgi:hypothetical protein
MAKRAFDKIAAGLKGAIARARQDRAEPNAAECESFGEYASRCFAGGKHGQGQR